MVGNSALSSVSRVLATGEVIAPQHSNLTTEPTHRAYVVPVVPLAG